ncbi:hypothetical protein FACS189441_0080 [Betaproteobacteria bacterium]|nr:hypothetical protein FACS189441_0080 [Betaproteobacteria bacterium]
MKRKSFIIISLLFTASAMQAQSNIQLWLEAARNAFNDGDYRTTLVNEN